MFHELDVQNIAQCVLHFTKTASDRLRSLGANVVSPPEDAHRSGIVAFELPGRDPKEVRRRCLSAGVLLSVRSGRLRISPHGYNDDEDLDRLLDVLK